MNTQKGERQARTVLSILHVISELPIPDLCIVLLVEKHNPHDYSKNQSSISICAQGRKKNSRSFVELISCASVLPFLLAGPWFC